MPDATARRRGMGLRAALLLMVAFGVAGCGGGAKRALAPDTVPARMHHANTGPTEVTLMTVVNTRTGVGDHAALLISGTHRVIYDPAGSFDVASVPRRHDVIYGVSPAVEEVYLGYHVRATHHVLAQTRPLKRAEADALIAAAEAQTPATAGLCAIRAGAVLRTLPELSGVSSSPFPRRLSQSFAAKPGVTARRIDVSDIPERARTRGPGFVADTPASAPHDTPAPVPAG